MAETARGSSRRAVDVLVAVPDPALRAGVFAALPSPEFTVVAECETAAAAAAAAARDRADVSLVDVDLPGGGVAVAAAFAQLEPPMPVVLLARTVKYEQVVAALRSGATGLLLLSDLRCEQLADEVRAVARGEAALSRGFATAVVDLVRSGRTPFRALSAREAEVLALLREGLTTKQIAQRLGIEPPTVRRHVSSARRKLGAGDRRAALELLEHVHDRRGST
jgi:DNA-binding NarL/FixJ family response regulator